WSIQHLTGAIGLNNPGQTAALAQVQGKTAIMPDYAFKSGGGGTSMAGLLGAALTFALAGGVGLIIRTRNRNRNEKEKSEEIHARRLRGGNTRGIGDRIHELYALEGLSGQDTAFHRLHPGAKILFTAAYILTIVSFGRYDVLGCIPYFLYPAVVMPLARLPASLLLRRFLIALPFCAFAGVTNFFLDQNTAFTMGGIAVSYGLLSLITILLRTFLCVMAVFILIATTPFPSLTRTLRQFHIPQFFIQLIEMIYRYLGVLTEEAGSMSLAYKLRSAGARGIEMRHMGSFAGQLALRSFDRGERVYNAMLCRGYGQGFPDREKIRFRRADGICAAALIALFLLLRFFPPLTLL
ncbi:MAG: cobalt ECF transporter T component CbiQ, partial [Clostridiales bacterium]|nr:cobalt ECF transporter T component CbiQ [Clostridiales bacterium]